ncbi:MAG: potassium transporter Kup [Gammaproteobacteria bacterium]|nr:potassium transporter Kup [Gammaproteobacteria bacterium]
MHTDTNTRFNRALLLAALGIVFGDIGTSPLYALRECLRSTEAITVTQASVLGVLSLMFWSLILVVTIKYVVLMLRADNDGEGGILALLSLVTTNSQRYPRLRGGLIILGIIGAAMLYADALITPAISVLSAVEGLEAVAADLEPVVIPLSVAILVGLFMIQHHGTAWIGKLFGPVMLIWFVVIGALGAMSVAQTPAVLAALDPRHAVSFFATNGFAGFALLGMVILVITGGEALYADMGHVGRGAIRWAWFGLVLPGLLLSYFGQGAELIRAPDKIESLFFDLAPQWGLLPLVALATMATIIASQAVIAGVYSLTSQAMNLGYCPRMNILRTSDQQAGQIYIPLTNWIMLVATVWLVIEFRESGALAGAYGLAVAGSMLVTAMFLYFVARMHWSWSRTRALLVAVPFVVIHAAFFGATLLRLPAGGWVPLAVGIVIFSLLTTWQRGRIYVRAVMADETIPVRDLLESLRDYPPARVSGTAVYLTQNTEGVPRTLLHNLKHNRSLHEDVALVTVRTENVPRVPASNRVEISELGERFYRIILHYGFREEPDVAAVLQGIPNPPLRLDPMVTSYFSGRETMVLAKRPRLPIARWRRNLFRLMQHNSTDATMYFGIPPNRVIQIGSQIEI